MKLKFNISGRWKSQRGQFDTTFTTYKNDKLDSWKQDFPTSVAQLVLNTFTSKIWD